MMGKTWERYFIRQTLANFFLILSCFLAFYFLIDYSSKSGSHHSHPVEVAETARYYLFECAQRLDVLIPFALLISVIRVLVRLNGQNELVALLAGGIKMRAILRPFLFLGLIFTGLIYLNSQFAIPKVLKEIRHIQDARSLGKNKKRRNFFVQHLSLKDNSLLLFQDYHSADDKFFDAYWIKSFNEIYYIKYLFPNKKPVEGEYVSHLVRNDSGQMEKIGSYALRAFPEMRFNRRVLLDTVTPPEELSLSNLWRRLPGHENAPSEKEAQIAAVFYQKMAIPWLCLLAVLGPAPLCVRFSRNLPIFFIYTVSLFGLTACFIILNAAVVLASRQVLPAFWAVAFPIVIFCFIAILRFLRIDSRK